MLFLHVVTRFVALREGDDGSNGRKRRKNTNYPVPFSLIMYATLRGERLTIMAQVAARGGDICDVSMPIST